MKVKRTMHVLTDKKGAIVGGGVLTPGKDHKGKPVHIRVEPMKGQSLKEVAIPADLAGWKEWSFSVGYSATFTCRAARKNWSGRPDDARRVSTSRGQDAALRW